MKHNFHIAGSVTSLLDYDIIIQWKMLMLAIFGTFLPFLSLLQASKLYKGILFL